MRIDVFTIFPEWFAGPFDTSLLGKARAAGRLDLRVHDLRDHTTDRHRSVDDTRWYSSFLSSGPPMIARPESPPFLACSNESSRNPPL